MGIDPASNIGVQNVAAVSGAKVRPDQDRTRPKPGQTSKEMTPEQEQAVKKLKQRDQEVRAHEAAHRGAGGAMTGGATYSYQTGPDGRRYAVGGEVSIEVSKEKDPQATIAKMQRVKAAALAPANPSATDRAVAQKADAIATQARQELSRQTGRENDFVNTYPVSSPSSAHETPVGYLVDVYA